MPDTENSNSDESGFDFKSALSQRDKKIDDLIQQNQTLQQNISTFETQYGELKGRIDRTEADKTAQHEEAERLRRLGEYELTEHDRDEDGRLYESGVTKTTRRELDLELSRMRKELAANSQQPVEMFQRLEAKLDQLQRQSIDTSFNVQARLSDPDFVKFTQETRYSPLDPNSPTLEEVFVDRYQNGDMIGLKAITDTYDAKTRQNTSSLMPSGNSSKRITPEMKKSHAKIDELQAKMKLALRQRKFNDAKALDDQIRLEQKNV